MPDTLELRHTYDALLERITHLRRFL
ncbi:hypothetical protein Cabther_B0519 [Chloracidobacterium thermophilum B]|uniref:Uncharacterized protein n=1 Tax=Chloracidobacterium thermophilum (strain B) TaxID=981222 RepID=G2LLV5_CHLTF|nr:hypothetical protein Cabther_B0519 [Chloracidobacterium thermophilum B]